MAAAGAAPAARAVLKAIAVAKLTVTAAPGREDGKQLAHMAAVTRLAHHIPLAHLRIRRKYFELCTAIRTVKLVERHPVIPFVERVSLIWDIIAQRTLVMVVMPPLTNPEGYAIIEERHDANNIAAHRTWTIEKWQYEQAYASKSTLWFCNDQRANDVQFVRTAASSSTKYWMASLILAQDKRWRRA
jgi:hypothetical protein